MKRFAIVPATAALLAVATTAAPGRAQAARRVTARLDWTKGPGGASCIGGAALARSIDARWGRSVFTEDADADVVLRGSIDGAGGDRYRALLELVRKDGSSLGSRVIETTATDCSALDDSVALAAGLMLDVSIRKVEEERALAEATAPPAVPEKSSVATIRIPADTPPRRASLEMDVSAGLEGSVGLLPLPAFGLRLATGLEPPSFPRFEIGASWYFDREARAAGHAVGLGLRSLDLAVCPLAFRGVTVDVSACAAQRVGVIAAEGRDLDDTERRNELVATLGPVVHAGVPLRGGFGLVASIRAEVPLVRYRFVYLDAAGRERSLGSGAPLAGTGFVGLRARF